MHVCVHSSLVDACVCVQRGLGLDLGSLAQRGSLIEGEQTSDSSPSDNHRVERSSQTSRILKMIHQCVFEYESCSANIWPEVVLLLKKTTTLFQSFLDF